MSKNLSGIKRVGHSSDGVKANATWLTGKIANDGDVSPDNVKTDDSLGQIYGGSLLSFDLGFLDDEDESTIEAKMTADTEDYWHIEYKDGRDLVTARPINVFTVPGTGVSARDGVVAWRLQSGEQYNDTPML